jgi:hypothetical protein
MNSGELPRTRGHRLKASREFPGQRLSREERAADRPAWRTWSSAGRAYAARLHDRQLVGAQLRHRRPAGLRPAEVEGLPFGRRPLGRHQQAHPSFGRSLSREEQPARDQAGHRRAGVALCMPSWRPTSVTVMPGELSTGLNTASSLRGIGSMPAAPGSRCWTVRDGSRGTVAGASGGPAQRARSCPRSRCTYTRRPHNSGRTLKGALQSPVPPRSQTPTGTSSDCGVNIGGSWSGVSAVGP